jgi:hypothetical protein
VQQYDVTVYIPIPAQLWAFAVVTARWATANFLLSTFRAERRFYRCLAAVAVSTSEKVSGKMELAYYRITDEYDGSWQERTAVIPSLVFVK